MLVSEAPHELTTPRIAPLCDPLGGPIRFVETDFPLFMGSKSGPIDDNATIVIQLIHSTVTGYCVIFANLRLRCVPINKLALRPYLGAFSRMKW